MQIELFHLVDDRQEAWVYRTKTFDGEWLNVPVPVAHAAPEGVEAHLKRRVESYNRVFRERIYLDPPPTPPKR